MDENIGLFVGWTLAHTEISQQVSTTPGLKFGTDIHVIQMNPNDFGTLQTLPLATCPPNYLGDP